MPILDVIQLVYGDVIEPIFCIIYAYIIVCIFRSNNAILRSPFYVFTMATGICAISNVLINWSQRMIDIRTHFFPDRGIPLVLHSWLSHIFALSLTLGKILTVSTRYISICMHTKEKWIWTGRTKLFLLMGMFLVPFTLYAFFPFMPANFAPTPDGYGQFIGISHGYKEAKAIATVGYILFFLTTVPMCAAAVIRLRNDRQELASNARVIPKYERTLLIYAVILTATHMIKCTLQTIWFIALYMEATHLQSALVSLYMIPNTLSSFSEPVLLLFTSSQVRAELCPCTKKNVAQTQSVHVSTLSNPPK